VALITTLLALVAGAILFFHFWYWIIIGMLLAVATFLMLQRLHELSG
jgi:hypothetical protein